MMIRQTIHFVGRVQGVGFRYTVINLARDVQSAGYVQNLPDGRVRLVAEGQADELERLLERILTRMAGYIQQHSIDTAPASGEFGQPRLGGVTIRY